MGLQKEERLFWFETYLERELQLLRVVLFVSYLRHLQLLPFRGAVVVAVVVLDVAAAADVEQCAATDAVDGN